MAEDNLNTDHGTGELIVNDPGNNQPTWMAQLPDDLKNHEVLTRFETIGDLGRNFIDLRGKTENAIQKLGENATDEEKATFWNSIGRPESPEGYEFEKIQLPEGIPYDEEGELAFRKFAHEIGMTSQQAAGLHKWYADRLIAAHTELEKASKAIEEKAIEDHKKEWGAEYEANKVLAQRGYEKLGELAGVKEEFMQFMTDSELRHNPLFLKVFLALGKAMSEDSSGDTHFDTTTTEVKKDIFGNVEMSFPNTPGME